MYQNRANINDSIVYADTMNTTYERIHNIVSMALDVDQ